MVTDAELTPTTESNGAARIGRLKGDLVTSLFLQYGPFWEAVSRVRAKWDVHPEAALPRENDRGSTRPEDKLPRKWFFVDDREWSGDITSLIQGFVPAVLRRSGWDDFLGACVMHNPPEDRLDEFARFGRVYPRVFWPAVNYDEDEFDNDKLRSMIAPPIETVFIEDHDEDEPFMEYRIVVDGHTEKKDVVQAFLAIKAVLGGGRPGRPPMDNLAALQCAVLYDDYNGVDPDDGRRRLWTYKKLAARFRGRGVKNERSAEEHVKRGRELRKKFRST